MTNTPAKASRPRHGRAARVLASSCLAFLFFSSPPAHAQWDDDEPGPRYGWNAPPYGGGLRTRRPPATYPLAEPDDLPPSGVTRMLLNRGFRDITPPRRSGLVYVVEATDIDGRRVRLAVDCFTGFVVAHRTIGLAAPPERAAPPESPAPHSARRPPEPQRAAPREAARAEPLARRGPPLPPNRPGDQPNKPPVTVSPPAVEASRAEPQRPLEEAPREGWVTPPPLPRAEAERTEPPAERPRVRTIEGVTPVPARGESNGPAAGGSTP